ncbi:hypothetical protein SISNIDRAFT_414902 [Sistotremastrum niveocremeum HHB9708]|uniref:Tat pathway signal sequence n=1 Tax=Sistotremastrum niveocremeum HHB9708 TaxID=1314777 RepID=A0A164RNU2_9AGAM|nr:hypothetical protein SISNIDRAFT_414902 [Sistotremastrum niveocremeum HHB9708]
MLLILKAPAQDAVRYERRVFTQLGVRTKYHGPPTNETDEAWDSLYNMGISRITSSEAALLPNRTESIPEEEGVSVISLDVFHQLHCLNNIRQALWPERYGIPELIPSLIKGDPVPFDHVDHCVNILRENIMCNADITPDVWQWDEDKQMSFPRFDTVHTCRNWEAIIDWAKARQMNYVWDMSIHVGHEHDHRSPIG